MARDQVTYRRQTQSLNAATRRVHSTDFGVRMRNQMAIDLGPNEKLVDDDYVGISSGKQAGRWKPKISAPRLGLAIATSERLRLTVPDGESITDIPLRSLHLVHDEDNTLTFTVKVGRGPSKPLSLIFSKGRAPVAQFLRQVMSGDDGPTERRTGLRGRLGR